MGETKETVVHKDWYTIKGEVHSHAVNFKVYEITSKAGNLMESDNEDTKRYYKLDKTNSEEVDYKNVDFNKVEPFMEAFVKWDGCIDFHVNRHHLCGYSTTIQDCIKDMYTLVYTHLENCDFDLSDLERK